MEKNNSILSPVRETRDPTIWDHDPMHPTMTPDAKAFIIDTIHDQLAPIGEGYNEFVWRILVIGSITGFQYDDDSDVDTNVTMELDEWASTMAVDPEELRHTVLKTFIKNNDQHFIPGTAHPLNLFLVTDSTMPLADGIYDVLEDVWLKQPGEPTSDNWDPYNAFNDAIERAETLAERIDTKWGIVQREFKAIQRYPEQAGVHKKKLLRNLRSLERIFKTLQDERHAVFNQAKENGEEPPQGATPNVVYKYLEWGGELDTLHHVMEALKVYSESGELDF